MKRVLFALFFLAFSVGAAVPAQAAVHLWEEFTSGVLNGISDDSAESLINTGTGLGSSATTIDIGDTFVGIFKINSFTAPTNKNFGVDWTNEFTGVFQLEVRTKVLNGTQFVPGIGPVPSYDFTFGPTGLLAPANPLGIAGWATGSMIGTWDQTAASNNFETGSGSIATAIDGTPAWQLGFAGGLLAGPGEGWATDGSDNIALYASPLVPVDTTIAQFFFSVNRTFTPALLAGIGFDPILSFFGGTVEFNGNGALSKPPATVGWNIKDDLNISFQPRVVPEPSSMAIWSIAALVVGFPLRRRLVGG